jgi:hypothetical protein
MSNKTNLSIGQTIRQAHDLTTTTLENVLQLIKTEPKLAKYNKDDPNNPLPFYLPSGTFSKNTSDTSNNTEYSGIICIDIDNIPAELTRWLKKALYNIYYSSGMIASVSSISNNIYLLFTTTNKDNKHHQLYYDIIYQDVVYIINNIISRKKEYEDIKLDYLPNLNRARYLSYDPDILIVEPEYQKPYHLSQPLQEQIKREYKRIKSVTSTKCGSSESQSATSQKSETNYPTYLDLATAWNTHRYGKFNLKESGNRNKFIHDFASATNNLGVPKELAITYIQDTFFTDTETGEQHHIDDEFVRAIDNAYSRQDQFGTYQIESDLSLPNRLEELINKKLLYLSKIDESKSLYLLNEINLLKDLMEQI